jgi:hypothetical protein
LKHRLDVLDDTLLGLSRIDGEPAAKVDITIRYTLEEYENFMKVKEYNEHLQIPPTPGIIKEAIKSVESLITYYKEELDLLGTPTYADIRLLMGEFGEDITLKELTEKFKDKEGESNNEEYFKEIVKNYYEGRNKEAKSE